MKFLIIFCILKAVLLEWQRRFWYNTRQKPKHWTPQTEFKTMEEQIKAKLETLRAGLQADGGDLELVKIDGKVVYLKLVGHCGSCPFAMMTLKQGIEAGLQEIDPEITVERVE